MLVIIRIYFKIISFLIPKTAGNLAFELFKKVRKKDIRSREKGFYDLAKKYTIPFEGEYLDCFEFGSESKDLVVLVHGWDSNAGAMYGFIEKLLAENKRVIAFNLPAHGFYQASKTDIRECKQAFKTLIAHLPAYDNLSIIAHSFGSGTVAYAMSELDIKVDKLIFLTSPNSIEDVFLDYKNMIGLNKKAYGVLTQRADSVLGEPLEALSIAQKLTQVKFNNLHIIHDRNDKIIPYRNATAIQETVPNVTLTAYENIGHYRMLWNTDVITKSIDFLTN